jgi:hypothetical protein
MRSHSRSMQLSAVRQSRPGRRRGIAARLIGRCLLILLILVVLPAALCIKAVREGQHPLSWLTGQGGPAQPGGLGPAATEDERMAAEQKAADELRQRQVIVVTGPPEVGVSTVNFVGKPVDDSAMLLVAALYRVQSVILENTDVTDDQLRCLAGLTELTSVVLNGTSISDAGLAHLAKLPNLESLCLRSTKVSDAGLPHIAKLPNLAVLDLSRTRVTNAGLPRLANLKKLQWLVLQDDDLSDAGLAPFEKFPSLRRLTLKGTNVSNAGINRLKAANATISVD